MVDPSHFITVGYDQRLILWRLEDGFEHQQQNETCSSDRRTAHFLTGATINIGDVESLSYSCGLIAVVGQGVQLFNLLN